MPKVGTHSSTFLYLHSMFRKFPSVLYSTSVFRSHRLCTIEPSIQTQRARLSQHSIWVTSIDFSGSNSSCNQRIRPKISTPLRQGLPLSVLSAPILLQHWHNTAKHGRWLLRSYLFKGHWLYSKQGPKKRQGCGLQKSIPRAHDKVGLDLLQ